MKIENTESIEQVFRSKRMINFLEILLRKAATLNILYHPTIIHTLILQNMAL